MGCHVLFRGIFSPQGVDLLHLPHRQVDPATESPGKPSGGLFCSIPTSQGPSIVWDTHRHSRSSGSRQKSKGWFCTEFFPNIPADFLASITSASVESFPKSFPAFQGVCFCDFSKLLKLSRRLQSHTLQGGQNLSLGGGGMPS